jgi:hypothetical protein
MTAMLRDTELYEKDFYTWANEQAAHIRAGNFDQVDRENIAEELEALGRSEAKELKSRYRLLLTHLLKWHYQPNFRSASWVNTINRERLAEIPDHLLANPGLKSKKDDLFREAYRLARYDAISETGLADSLFPPDSPFTLDEAMDPSFWPD